MPIYMLCRFGKGLWRLHCSMHKALACIARYAVRTCALYQMALMQLEDAWVVYLVGEQLASCRDAASIPLPISRPLDAKVTNFLTVEQL